MAAATSCSASTHENVRRACSAASAAARQARLTWVGPAASQCRASSAIRSSGPTSPATAASSASVWATWAWSRASRDGLVVVATASRVRAWVNATVPASGSSTSPASRAGVQRVVDVLDRLAGHRGQQVEGEPPAEHGGEEEQLAGPLGQALQAAQDDVPDGRRQRGVAGSRAPSRASSTRKYGLPPDRAVPVVRDHLGRDDGAA